MTDSVPSSHKRALVADDKACVSEPTYPSRLPSLPMRKTAKRHDGACIRRGDAERIGFRAARDDAHGMGFARPATATPDGFRVDRDDAHGMGFAWNREDHTWAGDPGLGRPVWTRLRPTCRWARHRVRVHATCAHPIQF